MLWSLLFATIVLLSPVDIAIQDLRPVFTWTHDPSITVYTISLAHADGTTYALQVDASNHCNTGGICVWQTPVYLHPGTWTWSVNGSSSATFQVFPGHEDLGGVIMERRMTYDSFISAAGFTALGVLVLTWVLFDIMRSLVWRRG